MKGITLLAKLTGRQGCRTQEAQEAWAYRKNNNKNGESQLIDDINIFFQP